jgi:hypothetical protein
MVGPRSYNKLDNQAPELPSGWSFNVFTQDFYNFMQGDPRFNATVFDLKSLKESTKVLYRTDNGFVYTAMFKFKGFDTGIEILFRHPDKNIFDPKQVFG